MDVKVIGPGESDFPGFISAGPVTVIRANGARTPVALGRGVAGRVLGALADVQVAHIHEPLMPQVSLAALRRLDRVGNTRPKVAFRLNALREFACSGDQPVFALVVHASNPSFSNCWTSNRLALCSCALLVPTAMPSIFPASSWL